VVIIFIYLWYYCDILYSGIWLVTSGIRALSLADIVGKYFLFLQFFFSKKKKEGRDIPDGLNDSLYMVSMIAFVVFKILWIKCRRGFLWRTSGMRPWFSSLLQHYGPHLSMGLWSMVVHQVSRTMLS
jgi:hypothetical protein